LALDDDVGTISAEVLSSHPKSNLLEHARKVLFKTKNSSTWHTHQGIFQEDYVGIDTSGAEYLAKLDLDLIGVDYLSIAAYHDTDLPHQLLLQKEIILLEGIDLSEVPEGMYSLYCLPLLIEGCEGAPARAILIKSHI
jgi:arylformamidase